jgi:hypothetical protein
MKIIWGRKKDILRNITTKEVIERYRVGVAAADKLCLRNFNVHESLLFLS